MKKISSAYFLITFHVLQNINITYIFNGSQCWIKTAQRARNLEMFYFKCSRFLWSALPLSIASRCLLQMVPYMQTCIPPSDEEGDSQRQLWLRWAPLWKNLSLALLISWLLVIISSLHMFQLSRWNKGSKMLSTFPWSFLCVSALGSDTD